MIVVGGRWINMKNKSKTSKLLLITCVILTIIYTIIIMVPLLDIVRLALSSITDNDIDLISKIMGLFADLMFLGVLILPYYFLLEKVNKKKSICNAMLAEVIIGFSLCFFLWAMAPAICADDNGGQWESVNSDTTNHDNNVLICKFINK